LISPLLGERVTAVMNLGTGLPAVMADAGQLEQVLINLAINARDAMPDGGTLEIATAASDRNDRMVRISVADTGTGMDADTIAHLFEPFYTTKGKGKGTGLGLATAYGIIKQSFGEITVESTIGKGSTFTVALPMAPTIPATVESPTAVAEMPPVRRSSGKRVLLVEDDNDVRDFAREVLTRTGYTVFPARHGVDGLAVAQAQAYAFDLVVTDVVMPEMGGRQMVVKLRKIRPNLPVLYISGYADDAEARREVGAGEESLLEKPFTARTLRDAVMSVSVAD
jgi:two-component system, cell cycle sensor histidine kinase and response regulator CckA